MASKVYTLYTQGSGQPFGGDYEGPLTNSSTAGIDYRGLLTLTTATTISVAAPAGASVALLTVPVWPASAVTVVAGGATGDAGQAYGYGWGFACVPCAGSTVFAKVVTANTAATAVTMAYQFG